MLEGKNVALYMRLSKEDEFLDESEMTESNSIISQRKLLRGSLSQYGLSEKDVVEYVDDGYSGKNFDRPAVKQLLQDVRSKKIKTILVKDFSRFGRDHIVVGEYIETIFPFLSVRFIAVSLNYDSHMWMESEPDMNVGFQNIINDYFSEENSIKIKKVLYELKKEGKYFARIPLYGYLKSEDDVHQLVIDEVAAKIVRRIFQYRLDGRNGGEIARILNREGVLTPTEYFFTIGMKKNHGRENDFGKLLWQAAYINAMIRNEEYTGCMIAGKYQTLETGSPQIVMTNRKEWIIVSNTHQAIIDRDTFEKAQRIFSPRKQSAGKRKPKEYYESFLKGLVRCGGCGHKLTRKAQKHPSYYCKFYYLADHNACVETTFPESSLKKIVVQAVHNQILFVTELEQLYSRHKQQMLEKRVTIKKQMEQQKKILRQLENKDFDLYRQYSEELISADQYQARKQLLKMQMDHARNQIEKLQMQLDSLDVSKEDRQLFFSHQTLADGLELEQISKKLAEELIECVYIHSQKKVEIQFRFMDPIQSLK